MTGTLDQRLDFAATARNRDAILDALKPLMGTAPVNVLEIASGSGQHAIHMASGCPTVTWWPTELNADYILSIDAWRREAAMASVRPATRLDVTGDPWRRGDGHGDWPTQFDGVVNINMIHIAPWRTAEGLIEGAGRLLAVRGFLYFYGPFKRDGVHTADSNRAFDESLRAQNPDWGVRDSAEVEALARLSGFTLERMVEMPANNLSLIFRMNRPE